MLARHRSSSRCLFRGRRRSASRRSAAPARRGPRWSRASSASALAVRPPGRSTTFTRTGRPSTLDRAARRGRAPRPPPGGSAGRSWWSRGSRPRPPRPGSSGAHQHLHMGHHPALLAEDRHLHDVVHAGLGAQPVEPQWRGPRRTGRRPRRRSPRGRAGRGRSAAVLRAPGRAGSCSGRAARFVPKPMPVRQSDAPGAAPPGIVAAEVAQDRRAGGRDALAGHAVVEGREARRAAGPSRAPAPAGGRARSCTRPEPSGSGRDAPAPRPPAAAIRRAAATMSAIESKAPTSWNATASTGDAVDPGLGLGEVAEDGERVRPRPRARGRPPPARRGSPTRAGGRVPDRAGGA